MNDIDHECYNEKAEKKKLSGLDSQRMFPGEGILNMDFDS